MKKRLACIIVALVSVIAMSILLISCSEDYKSTEPKVYTVSYKASEGGYIYYYEENERIEGKSAVFNVKSGGNIVEIAASPNIGYVFDRWTDGVTTPTRHDKNVTNNITVTALFKQLEYTVKFVAGEHGSIDGEVEQSVAYGYSSTTVTAMPEKGYMFVKWSDGDTAPVRRELYVYEDRQVAAEFAPISREYRLNYRLNSETELNQPTVKLTYGELDGVKLPVLEKEHFVFDGWYYDGQRVADENGELLIDDDFVIPEIKKHSTGRDMGIEAKWKAEETFGYKILIVYVTEIEADLLDCNRNIQHVQFQMTDEQKRFCHENTKLFEQYMEDMMDGLVDFEVDEYFTTQTVYSKSFKQSFLNTANGTQVSTHLYPSYIPEVRAADMTEGYDASVSVFGFCEDLTTAFEQAYRFQNASGATQPNLEGECEVYLDSIWKTFFYRGATSIDDVLSHKSGQFFNDRIYFVDTFTHEIAHTIEMRINCYNYHGTISIWGIDPNIGGIKTNKMYYLNELILDGERIGIPYGYWKGEVATVTYDVSTSEYGNMGTIRLVTPRNPFIAVGDVQGVVYGDDADAVLAEPNYGYRFVRWSDGVTTPERKDKNITADFTVTAIFEPVVYTINVVASEGGGVRIKAGEVQHEITLKVEFRTSTGYIDAVAQEGYRFVCWSDGTTSSMWSEIMQGDAFLSLFDDNNTYTLTAIFEKIE